MASGEIGGITSNNFIISKIVWSSIPSTANNNSIVTASLYYMRINEWTGTATSGEGSFTITIDGQSGSTSLDFTVPNDNSWVKALTVTKTVSHNNDGSKRITISASGLIKDTTVKSTTCYGEAVLDNIPRHATIISAVDFTDEGNPSFTFTNPANAPLSCWLEPNPIGDHLCERTLSGASGTFTWDLTESERKQLRTACEGNSCTCRMGLYSTIGGTEYASYIDKTLSIVNGNPTFSESNISYADTSQYASITENPLHIVQNKSNLVVTVASATANKEAEISKYEVTVNGITENAPPVSEYFTLDFGKINSSSNVEISVKVTDSRGNTTTAKKTVTVLAWAEPTFNVKLERENNYEDTTFLTVNANISSVNEKNSMAIAYWLKESGGEYGDITFMANNITVPLQCDKNKAYVFKVQVSDAFSSVSNEYPLPKGVFPLFIDTEKNAIGINEFPAEGEALRVAGGIAHFEEGVKIGDSVIDYTVERDTDDIWTYEKWASGKAVCWGKRTISNIKIEQAWGSLYKSNSLFAEEYPKNLFIDIPHIFIEVDGDGDITHFSGGGQSVATPLIYFSSPVIVSNTSATVHFYAIGKWK